MPPFAAAGRTCHRRSGYEGPAVANHESSSAKAREHVGPGAVAEASAAPARQSQRRIDASRSPPAETRYRPDGLKATATTLARWPPRRALTHCGGGEGEGRHIVGCLMILTIHKSGTIQRKARKRGGKPLTEQQERSHTRMPPPGPASPAARNRPGGAVEYSRQVTARGEDVPLLRHKTPSWRLCFGLQMTMEAPAG